MELRVTELRVEHRRPGDTLGIGEASPRLSWLVATDEPEWRQAGYELEVTWADSREPWSSGRIESDESVLVPWPAAALTSRARCRVRVRVWGIDDSATSDGSPSAWSPATVLEAGLLQPSDWSARFVTPDWDALGNNPGDGVGDRPAPGPCPLLRRSFDVTGPIERARLYVTALGLYEIELNGRRVGDHVLTPGWSSYHHRLRYETLDVTALLQPGTNALGAALADGWYRGRIGAGEHPAVRHRTAVYGDRLALLAQLEIVGRDGTSHVIASDESWRAGTGPILASGIYDGETYDARLEQSGWSSPGFDDATWSKVRVLVGDPPPDPALPPHTASAPPRPSYRGDGDMRGRLVAPAGPPVRRTEAVRPRAITTSPSGRTIVDFGQNLVGCLRISVSGTAGASITLRHAEVLRDGEIYTANLRNAAATDRYTLRGNDEPEVWEPRFTFHGFRYVDVDGWPGEPSPDDLVAVVRHSDMERTGWFSCSDERINKLHDNIVWSMRGNFVDVPTDCPNRDERLGWTGDIQVFAPTACFLYDCAGLLASWLEDLAADQDDNGAVPWVVPNVFGHGMTASAWGDAATIVPWVLYHGFGDLGVLRRQYPSMRAWVEFVLGKAGHARLWTTGFQYGDWLDPNAPHDNPSDGRTDPHLVANAYLCRSLDILALAAELLGQTVDARRYRAVATEVRAAFAHEYLTPAGRIASDSQTAYALALQFGLLPTPGARDRAGRRLTELVGRSGHRIATGFVGTPLVCDALCASGDAATAYRLLTQEACPSWLYPVIRGATTVWERWDGILPDGRPNPDQMNSFNHYAFGSIADWLHRTVGGLAPAEPGYRKLRIAPLPGGGLSWASSRHRTPYGMAESSWRLDDADANIEVTAVVPPNCTATVVLPGSGARPREVGSGTHRWHYPWNRSKSSEPPAHG
jgi:alpha-L-rhamnosidase